ncbi:hypothetical protein [Pseudomonas savastanoi]|uniref:Uncharacterized protein n=1 Tax=Pseudomonas savastanoi TaxID=29438 RepID=A0AAW3M893_PSESS|nr:hypothetical protein [Pseudomonas savastanoi]KTC62424.1 hypothetical protein AO287_26530 [Pseudomonas savastanoi]
MNINHHYIAIKKLGFTPEYKSGKRNEGRFYALDSNGNRLTRYVEVIHSNSKIEIIKNPVFVPFTNNTNADVDGFFVRSESTHVANATKELLEAIKAALEHNKILVIELAKTQLQNI